MISGILRYFTVLLLATLLFTPANAHETSGETHKAHNVLFINSYAMTYTWSDSLVSGVHSILSRRNDINLFVEFLDAKRFDKSQFPDMYRLYKKKYRNTRFDVAIVSDNDALDFIMLYADSLIPGIPVIFCGINNPEDYRFDNTNFYGILDGIDLKQEIDLIARVMPDVQNLYFISDSATTTSLINLRYIYNIEPEYAGRFKFNYICGLSVDSLVSTVSQLEKASAIALINYYQDREGNSYNPENVNLLVTRNSSVPIFMESETLLGKGIAGGIFIKGRTHGRDAARLALKFIDNPGYVPPLRVTRPENRYYFDYKVLQRFHIDEELLPSGAVVVNKPHSELVKYLKYIFVLIAIIAILLLIVLVLLFNIRKRKKAENLVKQKLDEIREKNAMLEEAHRQVNDMNTELEEINEHLSRTNQALSIAKEKSEESDRLKSAFLANMSHEIRTPLNAIVGFSNLLNDLELRPDDRLTYSKIIDSNSTQLLCIIEDILDLSKIEAGQLKIYTETFAVNDMLSELTETFSKNRKDDSVKILLKIPESSKTLMLRTDPARFKQILSNLISNALKFTKEGYIEIGYTIDHDNEITFYVKDTGVGIDAKNLKNIFNRFWKSDEDTEFFHSGNGLGLSICQSLSEALNGKIWAESEKGKGSVFYLALHDFFYRKTENTPETIIPANRLSQDWSNICIAIAEDELSNQYFLSNILKKLHANIYCFRNGKEIVDFFKNHNHPKIDLILMDVKMPVMDGYLAAEKLKEINPEIPIIAQTAYAVVEDIEKIKKASFDDYIVKPIKPFQLIEKITPLIFP